MQPLTCWANKAVAIAARGAMYIRDSPIADFDHQEPWLTHVLAFMGTVDLIFVHAEGMDFASKSYR